VGEAARRRRAAAQGSGPHPATRTPNTDTDPRAAALAAVTRLVRLNPPGRVSLAGAYALGYGALGMAQHDEDGPDWFHDLDPSTPCSWAPRSRTSSTTSTSSATAVPPGCA